MTLEEFEGLTAKALRRLPKEFSSRLDNVVIIVKTTPDKAQVRRFGPGLLGLYEGISLLDRGTSYSGAMPDKITLFKSNIEAADGDEAALVDRIRHTVMHEIAHHFGMDDDELRAKGLY